MVGAAATRFGRWSASAADLAHEAVTAALGDAGMRTSDVGAVFVGCHGTAPALHGDALSVRLGLRRAGLASGDGDRVEHLSGSGARALHLAWRAVETGAYDVVVCLGAQRMPAGAAVIRDEIVVRARAEAARRYMASSGATIDHLALAAAKNLRHGAQNPMMVTARTATVSAQAVLESAEVEWPLTELMVAQPAGGAAAVVLTGRRAGARSGRRVVRVRASILATSRDDADDPSLRASSLAYRVSGIGPDDLDCAEIHDDTAAAELAAYETLHFVPNGQGPELIDSGFTALGGVLPVNASGGLLALGELDGASGVAQLAELARQLRGEAGPRQVAGARTALALSQGADGPSGRRVAGVTVLTAD